MTGGGLDEESSLDSDDSAELSGQDGKDASVGGLDDDSSDGGQLIDDDDDDENLNSDDLVDDDDDTVSENVRARVVPCTLVSNRFIESSRAQQDF